MGRRGLMKAAVEALKSEEDFDYYAELNCAPHHSIEMIKSEFKILVLECHPDKHPEDLVALQRFERLKVAYETLCNEKERLLYDRWRGSGISIPYKVWRESFSENPPVKILS